MKRLNSSIRTQLILVTIISLMVLAGTLEVNNLYQQQAVLVNSERRVGLTLIRSVNNTINSVRSFINSLSDIAELNTRLAELVRLNTNIDFIAVTDAAGLVIFHSDSQYTGKVVSEFAQLPPETTVAKVLPGFNEVFLTGLAFDSEGLVETPQYWIIVASASEPIHNLLAAEAASSVAVTGLFTVIAGAILIVFLQRYFVHPLEQLTQTANAIEAGNLNVQANARQNNEIGQLARSFNQMTHELAGLINSLEERVKERTRELEIARDEAERANTVKSAFLASMSHELRTPLNAIINFTKFVAKGAMGPINDEQSETLNEVIDSAKHLLNLINDVLDMSKIEAGSLKLFIETDVDLNAILKTLTSTGKTLVIGKPVDVQLEADTELPLIMGDKQRIFQILLNILSNACKFTDEGRITIRARQTDDEVLFAIEDTGPGISPEDQPLVFEAFKQTTTGLRQGGGTGLGMPISRSLAEAHGGRLWLESTPGKGSIFYVALPLQSENLELSVLL